MPRVPPQVSATGRRWRFPQPTDLISNEPIPAIWNYKQSQVPCNITSESEKICNQGDMADARSCSPDDPHRHNPSPRGSQSTERSIDFEPIAKPRNLRNARLQILLRWKPEQYVTIQVFNSIPLIYFW